MIRRSHTRTCINKPPLSVPPPLTVVRTYLAPLPPQHNHAVLLDLRHPRPRHHANARLSQAPQAGLAVAGGRHRQDLNTYHISMLSTTKIRFVSVQSCVRCSTKKTTVWYVPAQSLHKKRKGASWERERGGGLLRRTQKTWTGARQQHQGGAA